MREFGSWFISRNVAMREFGSWFTSRLSNWHTDRHNCSRSQISFLSSLCYIKPIKFRSSATLEPTGRQKKKQDFFLTIRDADSSRSRWTKKRLSHRTFFVENICFIKSENDYTHTMDWINFFSIIHFLVSPSIVYNHHLRPHESQPELQHQRRSPECEQQIWFAWKRCTRPIKLIWRMGKLDYANQGQRNPESMAEQSKFSAIRKRCDPVKTKSYPKTKNTRCHCARVASAFCSKTAFRCTRRKGFDSRVHTNIPFSSSFHCWMVCHLRHPSPHHIRVCVPMHVLYCIEEQKQTGQRMSMHY